jgi:2-oxoisovalerate dehydrogenase E2 component (dihydrolipoyl transacylase)
VLHEFRMPDAGEGLTEAEVLGWRVAVGDAVVVNQILLEVETAKAAVELPSPYAGVVVDVLAAPGDVVPVGQPIIRIEDGVQATGSPGAEGSGGVSADAAGGAGAAAPAGEPGAQPHAETTDAAAATPGSGARTAVLVGYGVKAEQTPLRRPRRTPHGADHVEPGPPGERGRPVRQGGLELGRALETRLGSDQVRAKPPVRRLARDLDVDLSQVVPTGPDGTITHDDVSRAAAAARGPALPGRAVPTPPVAHAADGRGSEVVPLTHVGRMMAHAMTSSAFTAVHVTEWVDVDVTAMTSLIRAARAREDMAGLSITPLTFAALGLVRAAQDHPSVNSSLDEAGENLLVHRSVHLGIAVDSPRGLIVPRIVDAQDLDLRGMGDALARLIETARAGRSRPEDLRGSTITITNVGVFGVDGGTPILNPGEVAILALGRVLPRPWAVDGRVEVRDVVTLALSFDHRVVDGAMGSRVLREVADFMADPATALTLT